MTARQVSPTTPRSTLADSVEHLADGAEQALHQVRERVAPSAARWASQAEELAHRSVSAVRAGSDQLRQRATAAGDRGVQFVKDEPVKAVLIAAAAGALLALLLGSRSRSGAQPTRHD
jgi:ElaB/YqjD/DUF883 family membrane-anchored ribosome-binding protein